MTVLSFKSPELTNVSSVGRRTLLPQEINLFPEITWVVLPEFSLKAKLETVLPFKIPVVSTATGDVKLV